MCIDSYVYGSIEKIRILSDLDDKCVHMLWMIL